MGLRGEGVEGNEEVRRVGDIQEIGGRTGEAGSTSFDFIPRGKTQK